MVTETPAVNLGARSIGHAVAKMLDLGRSLGGKLEAPASDRARYHLGRARRALDRHDIPHAVSEATRALELDDESPWPLVVLGRAALAELRTEDAIRWLELAWDRAPLNTYVIDLLMSAYERAGAYGRRQQAIGRAVGRGAPVKRWTQTATPTAA